MGGYAGDGTQTGTLNTAVGYLALSAACQDGNTAVGTEALEVCTNNRNTAVGYQAGHAVLGGDNNTLIGYQAGLLVAGGHNNTLIGRSAGAAIAEGDYNTTIGVSAGDNITSGNSNIVIGYNIDPPSATDSSQLNIGGWIKGVAGQITMPSQPAFQVHPSTEQSNIPINGATTIVFGSERFDVNADFASNTFTAPITGKYQFNVALRLDYMDTGTSYYELLLVTSNRTYYSIVSPNVLSSDPSYWTLSLNILADMDAADIAYVQVNVHNSGAAQLDIAPVSFFSGYLAC